MSVATTTGAATDQDDVTFARPFKKLRSLASSDNDNNNEQQESDAVMVSIQEFLTVPMSIIFRRMNHQNNTNIPYNNSKPLLTRAEAQILLRVSALAAEFDMVLSLLSKALERQYYSRHYLQNLLSHQQHGQLPTLRSLVPALSFHSPRAMKPAIQLFQAQLDRIMMELQDDCSAQLKQFSEQNFNMSDSLLDAFGIDHVTTTTTSSSGHVLAIEKRILGDIEEELAARIDKLHETTCLDEYITTNNDSSNRSINHSNDFCLAHYCYRLFGEDPPIDDEEEEDQLRHDEHALDGDVPRPLESVAQRLGADNKGDDDESRGSTLAVEERKSKSSTASSSSPSLLQSHQEENEGKSANDITDVASLQAVAKVLMANNQPSISTTTTAPQHRDQSDDDSASSNHPSGTASLSDENHSSRKRVAATTLSTLVEGCSKQNDDDDYLQDEETQPLPDGRREDSERDIIMDDQDDDSDNRQDEDTQMDVANTQTAVSALAGFWSKDHFS